MTEKKPTPSKKWPLFLLSLSLAGFLLLIFLFAPTFKIHLEKGWKALTQESKRILGWKEGEVPPEEKRIREEVIFKKMKEASSHQDWRALSPEYPRPGKKESHTDEEKIKTFKASKEFKEMDQELKAYLKKKEELFYPEPPAPSLKDATDSIPMKNRGAEKVIERLQSAREAEIQEKPLEENLRLGIKGPLLTRKILERPNPPQTKVKVEAEIELMLWVLPNGTVDRVVPSVRGDAELERISIQYLKQWRFAPLPKDQPQVEQWGSIPFKFKLQ